MLSTVGWVLDEKNFVITTFPDFFHSKKESGTPWICDHFDIRPHRLMVTLMAAFILSEKPVDILFNFIR